MTGKKIAKGQYGYMKRQKMWSSIRTIFLFALSLSIFGIGIAVLGTKESLVTVIAILGCLPAGRSMVNMIMFLRATGCSEKAKEKISGHAEGLTELYDMFFTSYTKNYPVSHMAIWNHVVCGYMESKKADSAACEKHLDTYLKQGGCSGVAVKIFDDIEKYCEGLHNLKKQEETDHGKMAEIVENLLAISL